MGTTQPDSAALWEDLQAVRERAPLVHSITNFVVMNFNANALLAVGASPVMAHAREEVVDMVGIAQALVLNIGTLEPAWIDAMPGPAGVRGCWTGGAPARRPTAMRPSPSCCKPARRRWCAATPRRS